jgi:hypothetical protein
LENIKDKLDSLYSSLLALNAKLAIAKQVEDYCKLHTITECPICLTSQNDKEFSEKVRISIEQATPEQKTISSEYGKIQAVYTQAVDFDRQQQGWKLELNNALDQQTFAVSQARKLLEIAPNSEPSEEDIKLSIAIAESSVKNMEESLQSDEFKVNELRKQINGLNQELRFHKYRNEQERFQRQLIAVLEPIREQLSEYKELESTVSSIRKELKQAFDEAIDRAIPPLDEMMTSVYAKLTQQSSFEQIKIERTDVEGTNILKFRVGSNRIPGHLFNPEDYLNGQANSSLRLLPYFVFSKFQAEALELDLLLIDDPSQSFDTSHVEFLLQELADAGSHAQLVIATHEEDRFNPFLSNYFSACDYEVVKFDNSKFDPIKGPFFDINC